MVLNVVKFGTPVLRQKGSRVETVTPALKKLMGDMLETMYAYKGIGLAAQQVGVPVQLTVLDVRGVTDRPSTLEIGNEPADIAKHMPMVLMNPEISPVGKRVIGPEGCLSFPEIYGDIERYDAIEVTGMNAEGQQVRFRCGGLLSRAIQHETDHLQGILFIDRMDKKTKESLRPELDQLQAETKAELKATSKPQANPTR